MKKKFKIVLDLPLGGAGCDSAEFSTHGLNFHVAINDGNGEAQLEYDIVFQRFVAFRFRDELHSEGFLSESYDCVCEILESDWVLEMVTKRPKAFQYFEARHFAVMLSNVGYLEVACESFVTIPHTSKS